LTQLLIKQKVSISGCKSGNDHGVTLRGTVHLFAQTPAQEQAKGEVSDCFLQAAKADLVISYQLWQRCPISRRYADANN